MISLIISIYIIIYFGLLLEKFKLKLMQQFYSCEYKNRLIIIIIVIIIFIVVDNYIVIKLALMSIFFIEQIKIIIKIVLLQNYFYYFNDLKTLNSGSLRIYLSYIEIHYNIFFINKKYIKYVLFSILFLILNLKLAIVVIIFNGIKNFYLYRMSHVYDSLILGHYFNEEIILNIKGKTKILDYKKNLMDNKKSKLTKILYLQDYYYCDPDQNI